MLNTFQDDPCCDPVLSKLLFEGKLDREWRWTCPKCGTDWIGADWGEIRHWRPVPMIEMLRV